MLASMSTDTVVMESAMSLEEVDSGDIIAKFVSRLLVEQPQYIGIYQPGDFRINTYRIVLPNPSDPPPDRIFGACREEVLLETDARGDIDGLIAIVQDLISDPQGPIGIRHIVNPSQNKDEGLRIIWRKDGEEGRMEMEDWGRRDMMIREGKTVREADDKPTPSLLGQLFPGGGWGGEGLMMATAPLTPVRMNEEDAQRGVWAMWPERLRMDEEMPAVSFQ